MTFQQAYEAWAATFPGKDNDCKCPDGSAHHYITRKVVTNVDGHPFEEMRRVPRPDDDVCERERAWRTYLSIRDGRNYNVLRKSK